MPQAGHWPPAELTPNPASKGYKKLWIGCDWEVFLRFGDGRVFPNAAGQEVAPSTPGKPGVYEFAISRTETSRTRHTVYVGMSRNLRNRHTAYARNGSHITAFMEEAVGHGNVLWRRICVLDTELLAQQQEVKCRFILDYPWNMGQNPALTRYLHTRRRTDGCLAYGKELVNRDPHTGDVRVKTV